MGACATKPKVLGDKFRRSRRHPSSNSKYNGDAPSFASAAHSSLKDEKRSLSFSDKDETIITPKEDEDVGSKTIVANHYVHQDELPNSNADDEDDDDLDSHDRNVHFGDTTKDQETDHIVSTVTNAIEEDENVVVEEPTLKEEEASGLTPTHELQDHTPNKSSSDAINQAGPHPQSSSPPYTVQNDVVETENPAGTVLEEEGQNDVVGPTNLVGVLPKDDPADSDPPPPTENDAVKTTSISDTLTHQNDAVEVLSPAAVADQLQVTPPPSYTSKDVVVEDSTSKSDGMQTPISSSTTSHDSSKDPAVVDHDPRVDLAELHGPIKTQSPVVYDHVPLVNKLEANEEDDVPTTNTMPSTFAF